MESETDEITKGKKSNEAIDVEEKEANVNYDSVTLNEQLEVIQDLSKEDKKSDLLKSSVETSETSMSQVSLVIPKTPPCTPDKMSMDGEWECDDFVKYMMKQILKSESTIEYVEAEEIETQKESDRICFKTTYDFDEKLGDKEKQEAECNFYTGVDNIASTFVDNLLDNAIDVATEESNKLGLAKIEDFISRTSRKSTTSIDSLRWPCISEFTKDLGEAAINDFVMTWEYDEDWLYCIDFIIIQSDECSDYYNYEVKWSIPTYPYPIPQATASVFFTIEVSRIKPSRCPVDVSYVFEGSRLSHAPGKVPFNEGFLFDIIDAKLAFYKNLYF
ncbi:hypothetical protein FQA39_LY09373 [Lamprigera yunnana]|nr:hypothetical protein FQA39_LY09373 [Lamprigera yunnana]